ncbi:MAG: hypothetical protein AAF224_13520 [Pseudomonadota bacterium]
MSSVHYLHLPPKTDPPVLGTEDPFSAVLVVEADVSWAWRAQVSRWLVDSGCLFMMAWGKECSLWDESVDYANLDDFPDGEIPEHRWVYTTWHDDEPKEQVFWFAQHTATHPHANLKKIMLIDISKYDRGAALLKEFELARDLAEREAN